MRSIKSVPVIDMAEVETLPQEIVKACEEFGCFRLKNHGIPVSLLMSDMKAVARSLLDLPLESKMKNFNPTEPAKGYIPLNIVSPFFDCLSLYDTVSPAALDNFCAQMDASTHQREIICEYTSSLNDLVQVMGSKLMEGLGFAGKKFHGGIHQLKMNKYSLQIVCTICIHSCGFFMPLMYVLLFFFFPKPIMLNFKFN